MARRVKIKWKSGVFRELRTLPEVQAELARRGGRIAAAAGDGYDSESGITGGRGRARTAVFTATGEAVRDNARNHSLLRALSAGQG